MRFTIPDLDMSSNCGRGLTNGYAQRRFVIRLELDSMLTDGLNSGLCRAGCGLAQVRRDIRRHGRNKVQKGTRGFGVPIGILPDFDETCDVARPEVRGE